MTAYLLHTKLCAPPHRPDLVSRPRLIERLNQGLRTDRRLILLSAPAGFGKTTLLVEWIRQASSDIAWLSLDEGDNDVMRFSSYLVAALQGIHPDIGQEAQAMLHAPQPPPTEAMLTSLLNDVGAAGQTTTLVLDDYHLIHSLPVHQMLAFLLEHLPACMRLAIGTRQHPPLPLPRLRARDQVVELRQADLQFTPQETSSFCRDTMRLNLNQNDMIALQQRTEGWIAGLQLAALSLQGSTDTTKQVHALTGSHRYILDYLIQEVFDQQPPEVQQFLLYTSILERLTAPLCDALTGRTDGRKMLLALERDNLFVHPLDVSRQWYRYHHLFAELLRHRLETECGDRVASLQQRASRWYAQNGYPTDAVDHALNAHDWESAAALLERITETLLNRGEVTSLLGWYKALPETFLRSRPQLCYEHSWPLLLTDQIELASEYLALAEASAGDNNPHFMGQIAVSRAFIARLHGDGRRVIELSQQALALLAEDDLPSRAIAALNVGITQWYRGRLDEAARALDEAQHAAARQGNDYAHTTALIFSTRLEAARGRLLRAANVYQNLIQSTPHLPTIALARTDLAKLLVEWNDLSTAADHAQQGYAQSRRNADLEVQPAALSVLIYVRQLQGQSTSVRALCDRYTELMRQPGPSPFAQWHALGYRALAALAAGDLAQAGHWLAQAPPLDQLPSVPEFLLLCLAQARLLLAQDQRAGAARLLATRREVAQGAGFKASLVETHAMLALCFDSEHDATDHLSQALRLGSTSRHIRAFLDLGQPMAERLQWAADRGIEAEYTRTLLAAFQDAKPQMPSSIPQPAPAAPLAPQPLGEALIEPLSERERAVLQLLSKDYTYQEIAQALYVSTNTVKTHLKHIYAKLGVHTRRQAPAKARELGIL